MSEYADRQIALGIRPEDMEDASLVADAPPDRRFEVMVDLREDMGSEVFLHFAVDGQPVSSAQVADAKEEAGEVIEAHTNEERTPWVVRAERATNAREGERIDLWVDTRRLYFFDMDTGLGIYG